MYVGHIGVFERLDQKIMFNDNYIRSEAIKVCVFVFFLFLSFYCVVVLLLLLLYKIHKSSTKDSNEYNDEIFIS